MYICLCNAITDRDIRHAAATGMRSFAELKAKTGCSDCCGCCEAEARGVFEEAAGKAFNLPLIAVAA